MKVLVIGKVWPESKSSAAGRRMNQLIQLFSSFAEITFATSSNKTGYEDVIDGISYHRIAVNDDDFDNWIMELNPEVVIFDRFMIEEQFGWRVMENCPSALRVLNTEDLHFLRKSREAAVKNGESFEAANLYQDETYRELASMYRVDINLMVSNFEIELLTKQLQFPRNNLFFLPIFSELSNDQISYSEKQDFVFIGNFLHEPNWDSVKILKTEIWPKIKKGLSNAKLHIYGAYAGQKVMQLSNEKDGFIVHGRAEDATSVIRSARIMLAPLRFGAGIKGKLLEAMENDTPSVTTKCGSESMALPTEWNGAVTDDWDEFAAKAIMLYSNEKEWEEATKNGQKILDKYDKSHFELKFKDMILSVKTNLEDFRSKNIFSSIINQQSLLSTKYLSRWIIEKNK